MAQKPSVPSNIRNRSPWLVQVRSQPSLDKQFPFSAQKKARAYLKNVQAQGRRATLIQLETSFQLRVRRQGVRAQFITFDSIEAAEQAR
ncbi:MAG TPA: hypothetical protein VL024_01830, partial [Castellaniella sp.]|nr:hypothetical protein [Castellaniella sp.]